VASIEEATRPNLKKTLTELGLETGSEIVVADPTSPRSIVFRLSLMKSRE
jgi:ubiquitin-activating enzyme E1 C